jgi:hypothetical protein
MKQFLVWLWLAATLIMVGLYFGHPTRTANWHQAIDRWKIIVREMKVEIGVKSW